ncbi:MAG: DUF1015 domain-containing protein [Gammaproteobacteria bacterium]|nr:DUF1015 domain-containing protein [Gammaproteobacteria bacterium]
MSAEHCFRLPRLLLPRPGLDLAKWAVIACDQYTSEPEYWRRVEDAVGAAPSTLHLIFPELYLDAPAAPARIARIQQTMRQYLAGGLLREHVGAVYVERTLGRRVRRGLMLELDLEQYDYGPQSRSPIRPTEGTIVERLAPRIEVRRDAELELPHVLVLIDDPQDSVIGPLAALRAKLPRLYEIELMLGGGHVAGYSVPVTHGEPMVHALRALADSTAFAARYGVPAGSPVLLFAVGDGNHSLATARACWDRIRDAVAGDHPARHALVEVVNIHDPALEFAPIHRLLFGVTADIRAALSAEFGGRLTATELPSAAVLWERIAAATGPRHVAGLLGPGPRFTLIEVAEPESTLAVGTFQPFVERFLERGGATEVDYVHGDETLARLAPQPGCVGLHLPVLGKHELLRRVVREGPLPRKAFSMGEADSKRFYVEARRIRDRGGA